MERVTNQQTLWCTAQVGMETGFGGRAPEGSVMEITNSRDFLGSRYPWVTDGRCGGVVWRCVEVGIV